MLKSVQPLVVSLALHLLFSHRPDPQYFLTKSGLLASVVGHFDLEVFNTTLDPLYKMSSDSVEE